MLYDKIFENMKNLVTIVMALMMGITLGLANGGPTGYEVGDKAEDFSLKNIDGNMVSLADYKEAKGFIVIFTCNHCPYAKLYEDRIIALHTKYEPLGYPVIAINPNDPTVQPEDSFENMPGKRVLTSPTFLTMDRKCIPNLEPQGRLMCFCWTRA